MKLPRHVFLLSAFGLLSFAPNAYAQSNPKLYPNAAMKALSAADLADAISTCENEAKGSVGVGNEKGGRKAARGAARGAALGALAGTITNQNVGRSTGAGAAVGGTKAALDNRKARKEGSPEYRAYVSACLEEKGLKVVGWE